MNQKKTFLIFILSAPLIIINLNFFKTNSNKLFDVDSTATINLSFVGDLMCHSPQFEFAKVSKDSFDFDPSFSYIKKYLINSDLTFGNLETVISQKKYSGYPLFNSPREYLTALKNSGFDILFTANNHCIDQGKKGLKETLINVRKIGLEPIGTFLNQRDRDSVRIYNINGFRIGIIAFTYGLNGYYLPKKDYFHVNIIDTNTIRSELEKIIQMKTDLNIVYYHFGDEYSHTPSKFQKRIVDFTIKCGADLIIASHPHVIQPIESFKTVNLKLKKGVVAYSLGNFLSNQRWRYSDAGVILNFEIKKHLAKDSISISDLNIIPTWVYKGKIESRNHFIILPADTSLIDKSINYLSRNDKIKMIEAFNDTKVKMKNPL